MQLTIPQLLLTAQQASEQLLIDTELQTRLIKQGFPLLRIQQGETLCFGIGEVNQALKIAYQAQKIATDHFYLAWREARILFQSHLVTANQVLADESSAKPLFGAEPREFRLWYPQAYEFYQALLHNNAHRERWIQQGLTVVQLIEGQSAAGAADTAKRQQERRLKETERLFAKRNEQVTMLTKWVNDLRKTAQRVFAKASTMPAWLESMPHTRIQVKVKASAPTVSLLAGL